MSDACLQTLISRFPRLELSITRLYRNDPEFRAICEEMEVADAARARWRDLPERADEYAAIFDRLQDELLEHLTRKTRAEFLRPLQKGLKDNGRNS